MEVILLFWLHFFFLLFNLLRKLLFTSPAGIASLPSLPVLVLLASIQQMNRGFQSSKDGNPTPFRNANCTFYDSRELLCWCRQSLEPKDRGRSRIQAREPGLLHANPSWTACFPQGPVQHIPVSPDP